MGVWISFQRFVKSLEHKSIVISVTENIRNDSPVAQVQIGTQIDFMYRDSLIPLEFRYIRKPFLVGTLCMKVAVQYVLNAPMEYAGLVLSGKMENYLKGPALHGIDDS